RATHPVPCVHQNNSATTAGPGYNKDECSTRPGRSCDIFAIGADASIRHNISGTGTQNDFPVPSPDGTKLAYRGPKSNIPAGCATGSAGCHQGEDGELWVVNTDGSGKKKLSNFATGPSIVWSP